ncbi:MAG: hypothetical protein GAK31_00020 [Stenotrophomonas maltophilia]|uniref:DUF6708 domain-containing protein n=1 Tax=Stenotrophomonas maltophilia TaxID=40324 RepID=A0A7V8FIT2_STEMA|nr:MAG: hypothetical protein GAK31_00020 [Stenotrophomonas maltophilia]
MYTGWMRGFILNWALSAQENAGRFDVDRPEPVAPDERACLVQFNSTYIDLIDRRFRLRGMVSTTMVLLGNLGLFLLGFFLLFTLVIPNLEGDFWDWVMYAIVAVCVVGAPVLVWYTTLKYEFFTYAWYPTRFNRRNRMVYFFTGGKEGAVRVPWDDAVFYIGRGTTQEFLRDLRCSIVEDGVVNRTFAVGHYFDDEQKIRGIWEFVRRYMENGPEAVVDSIDERQMNLSVKPSWRNCYLFLVASLGPAMLGARFVLMPLLLPLVLCRWLVLKSCRTPVWPQWVEDECAIDANDSLRLIEPEVMAQFEPDRRPV